MQPQTEALPDLAIESVSDEGTVVLRFPSGRTMRFRISDEMIPYYRRLAEPSETPTH